MLESGIVKFTFFDQDGSNAWRDLTALEYHYWTQPLPHPLSSWIHSLPQWFDQFSLLTMYAVELILPVLLFYPAISDGLLSWDKSFFNSPSFFPVTTVFSIYSLWFSVSLFAMTG